MKVEIWSDVVCPWCYVGKRRFEQALATFPHAGEVDVVYRSFELDPGAPVERQGSYDDHLARKYGMSVSQAQAATTNMTAVAAAEGLEFRFDIARPGNTFDAHRLLHHAATLGKQLDLKERLLHATFTDGEPIGDHATLSRLAKEIGIDDADEVLASDRYGDAVRADEQQAAAYGISGVPFFVVDGKYGVSGAQSADLLVQVLERAHGDSKPLTMVESTQSTGAQACDDGSCAV